MELTITLLDARDPQNRRELLVRAEPGTPLGELLPHLLGRLGAPCDAQVAISGRPVPRTAVLGLDPLLNGALLVCLPPSARVPEPVTAGPPWAAHVVAGPGAGARYPLGTGEHLVGRSAALSVAVDDPRVSRRHAALTLRPTGAVVRDLGSANGTWLLNGRDRRPVPPEGLTLPPGATLKIGDSQVEVLCPQDPPAAVTPDGAGRLRVAAAPPATVTGRRAGAERLEAEPATLAVPAPSSPPPPPRTPWAAIALPPLVMVPMAMWLGQPYLMVMAALSPVVGLGQWALDLHRRRREQRGVRCEHAAALAQAEERLAELATAETTRLHQRLPDLARLARAAAVPTRALWAGCGPSVRLGTHDRPCQVTLSAPAPAPTPAPTPGPGPASDLRLPQLLGVPLGLDLAQHPTVVLAGPVSSRSALASSIVGQLAVRLPPSRLRVEVIGEPDQALDWIGRLPHHRRGLADLLAGSCAPAGAHAPAPPGPSGGDARSWAVLVVPDGRRADPRVGRLLADPASDPDDPVHRRDQQVVLLLLADHPDDLACPDAAVVRLADDERAPARLLVHADRTTFVPDLPCPGWAEEVSRSLAALAEEAQTGGHLPETVRLTDLLGPFGADRTVARWQRRRSGAAPVGLVLDEHGDVGAWSLDLAADGPHLLAAGTTGSGKSELLVTLVAALAATSHPADLALMLIDYKGGSAFAGCADLPHVAGLVTDLDPHLAQRALGGLRAELRRREQLLAAHGVPDHRAWCVDPGRAHLMPRLVVVVDEFRVLGEELPDFVQGLVRVATVGRSLGVHLVLATQRPAGAVSADLRANVNLCVCLRVQSRADSMDVLDAAEAASLPVHLPGRAVVRTGGGALRQVQVATVNVPPTPATRTEVVPAGTPPPSPPVGSGRTDLQALVEACRQAARTLAVPPARPPWPPPLPATVTLGELPRPVTPGLRIGLVDDPEGQRVDCLTWDAGVDGHLCVIGGPRSGRSTVLATLADSGRDGGRDVYLVTAARSRAAVREGGHVGAVVAAEDHDRVLRLLTILGSPAARPRLLLVDDWDTVLTGWALGAQGQACLDALVLLLRHPGEVAVALAGGRSLLAGAVAGLLPHRLVLPGADQTESVLAGVPPADARITPRPGRAVLLGRAGVRHVQVALPGADGDTGPGAAPARCAPTVLELPCRLTAAELADHPGPRTGARLGLGLSATGGLEVVGVPAVPVLLVLGAAGSGRSSAARHLAQAVCGAGEPTGPGSRVRIVDELLDLPEEDEQELMSLLSHPGPPDVLRLVVVAQAGDLLSGYRPLLTQLRRHRSGLLLGPIGPGEAEALGLRRAPSSAGPPGRALLVHRGRARLVQLPAPGGRRALPQDRRATATTGEDAFRLRAC